jgi:hypothetical protein
MVRRLFCDNRRRLLKGVVDGAEMEAGRGHARPGVGPKPRSIECLLCRLQKHPEMTCARQFGRALSRLVGPHGAMMAGASGGGFEFREQLVGYRKAPDSQLGRHQAGQQFGHTPRGTVASGGEDAAGGGRRGFVFSAEAVAPGQVRQHMCIDHGIADARGKDRRLVSELPGFLHVARRQAQTPKLARQQRAFTRAGTCESIQPASRQRARLSTSMPRHR